MSSNSSFHKAPIRNCPLTPKQRKEQSKRTTKAERKKNKMHDNKNIFQELPKEIVILILLHAGVMIVPIVRTCKYLHEFITASDYYYMPFNDEIKSIWSILTRRALECRLTCEEHLAKQIFSCKSLGPMLLMKYIITLMKPIKTLFDKNNMSISDVFVYITWHDCFRVRMIHKNQPEYSLFTDHGKFLDKYYYHQDLLVRKYYTLCDSVDGEGEPAFYFRNTIHTNMRIILDPFPPCDTSNAMFHIKL